MPNVQHLSYAGISLPLCPSFLEDKWLSVVHDQYNFITADFWNFDKPNSKNLPTPRLPRQPKFQLDVLNWPTGASTPAFFHTIVETARLNQIVALAAPEGANTPQPLLFYDGNADKTITAQMYALPARPLNQLGKEFSDLWLLTLTDQRFYWHFARCKLVDLPSWDQLFTALGDALGVSIDVETVDPKYKTPGKSWGLSSYQASTSAILDAAASQVGQRVVVGLDGSVKTVHWDTARASALTYINLTTGRVISGGLIRESDIAKYVPGAVQTIFTDTSSTEPHAVVNLLSSLAILEYGTATGVLGFLQTQYADLEYDGSNDSDVDDYAEQTAKDWYGWRLIDTDIVYAGIEPWIPTGWEDEVSWTLKLIEQNPALPPSPNDDPYCKTHVRRGPWTDTQIGNIPTGAEPEYKDECLNGYLVRYKATISNDGSQTDYVFDRSLGIPCGYAVTPPFSSGSGNPPPNTIKVSVVTNVCIDASGGLVLQKQDVLVLGTGTVSSVRCASAKGITDCCPPSGSGSGSGNNTNPQAACCPNGTPATSIAFAVDGPVGPGCTELTLASVATQTAAGGLNYNGQIIGAGFLTFTLYCIEGEGYRATGHFNSFDRTGGIFYDVEMTTDPISGFLIGEIGVPGCGTATLAATQPCGSGGGSGSGSGSGTVTVACCPGGIARTLYLATSSCAGLAAGRIPLIYASSGTDGAAWYSSSYSTTGGTVRFVYYCDIDLQFHFKVYCNGVGTGGGTTGVNICNYTTGVGVNNPTLGLCCDIGFIGTIFDAP